MKRKKGKYQSFMSFKYCVCMHTHLCPTLRNPLNCSPLGSSVHGIFQKEYWLPVPPPGGLPDPGIEPVSLMSPALAGGFFTAVPPEKPFVQICTTSNSYSSEDRSFILVLLPFILEKFIYSFF